MTTPTPSVTTVIATRGRGALLRRALRSIMSQVFDGHLEILVVFDQSDIDPLDDLRAELPVGVTLVLCRNDRSPGLAGARNTGIARAVNELIAFCDDDDEWAPHKLQAQIRLWQQHPEAAVIACGITIVTLDDVTDRMPPLRTTRADLLRSRVGELHPSSFLFRRADLVAMPGGVDEGIPFGYGEDYDYLLRVTELGDVLSVPDHLVIVHWDRDSYFAGRWERMAEGLSYLLTKHPDLLDDARNAARMSGQVAFAYAAAGKSAAARTWTRRTLGHRPTEPRAWLALLTMTHLLSPQFTISTLNKRGRGI
ncbi:glycosyltransferase family 2 protein [Brachybacterium sp. UNK5269]|uniref:glycosyltransferase family 2 protein n=1 Tax=Brachybacterium sp. UNK5269 TaxID=3408576 RepID=UPI003BAEF99B